MKPHGSGDRGGERRITGKHAGLAKWYPGLTQLSATILQVIAWTPGLSLSMGGRGLSPRRKSCNTTLQVVEIRWNVENYNWGKKLPETVKSFPKYWLKTYRFKYSGIKYINLNTQFSAVSHRSLLLGSPTILILPSVPLLSLNPLHTLTCHLKALQWTLSTITSICHILFLLSSFPGWEDLLCVFHLQLMTCNILTFS